MNKFRNNDLAKIHIAKQALGLDDDTYRAMLWTVARVRSSSDLDEAGRRAVLQHMKSRGFKPHQGPRKAHKGAANYMSKVEALLADMQLPWSYATSMAKQMFKRDKLEWLRPDELEKLMVALIKEQEKRLLLARLDEILEALGMERGDAEKLIREWYPAYRSGWERDATKLQLMIDHFTMLRQVQEADDEAADL